MTFQNGCFRYEVSLQGNIKRFFTSIVPLVHHLLMLDVIVGSSSEKEFHVPMLSAS
jgi:hypothetical protein